MNATGPFPRVAAALAVAILCLDGAAAAAPVVIRFSHTAAEDSAKGRAAEYFKGLAEERTHGRVRVEVFANSTLYGDKDELEALQLGAVQMLAASLNNFSVLGVREFEAFELPYLFQDYEALHRVTDGPVGAALLATLEPKGIRGLAYWDNGFKQMSANKPLRLPDDLKGLRMRIRYSSVSEAQMRAVGVSPRVLAYADTFAALQSGALDGTEHTASFLYAERLYQVQKYVTLSDHGYLGSAVVVNRRFWEKLPSDIRAALEGAMRDATRFANESARRANDDAIEALKRSGTTVVITLTAEEKAAWKRAFMKVHRDSQGRIPEQALLSIYSGAGFHAAE